jgi:hypothetical protein
MAFKASQIEIEHKEYDPYVILGIDRVNIFFNGYNKLLK